MPDCAMQHSVMLMQEIERTLDALKLKPEDCDFFAAVTGPGSFTGIRIGIATVKGFALATNKPLKSVTAFELIAYNVNSEKPFLVAVDAAHNHFYVCGFEGGKIIKNPCYLSFDEVAALSLPVYGFENLNFDNYTRINPSICLSAAVEKCDTASEMHALYVRKSQAEENYSGT